MKSARIWKHIRRHGVAYAALFFAFTGSAYALSRGEVKTKHIANGAVKTAKIADNAVTGAKIADGAVALSFTDVGLPNGLPGCGGDSWGDQSPNVNYEAAYARDRSGLVHLRGTVRKCSGSTSHTIFTLPEGLRPEKLVHLATMLENGAVQQVAVHSDGRVEAEAPVSQGLFLDGLSFAAG